MAKRKQQKLINAWLREVARAKALGDMNPSKWNYGVGNAYWWYNSTYDIVMPMSDEKSVPNAYLYGKDHAPMKWIYLGTTVDGTIVNRSI
jgi:hypothetical protein